MRIASESAEFAPENDLRGGLGNQIAHLKGTDQLASENTVRKPPRLAVMEVGCSPEPKEPRS